MPGRAGFWYSAGSVSRAPAMHPPMMALTGVRLRFTLDQSRWPGTARSRLNAHVIRDMLVTQLMPQKNCPMVETMMTVLKKNGVNADWKIAPEKPPAELIASTLVAANRKASS